MRVRTLTTELRLPRPIDEIFAFFSDANNLEILTPPWLHFRILTPQPLALRLGAILEYQIRWRGVPLSWKTEIAAWEPPHRFIDREVRGPYSLWVHEHTFETCEGGTLLRDRVDYAVPGWFLEPILDRFIVRPDVQRIFDYRKAKMRELFPRALASYRTDLGMDVQETKWYVFFVGLRTVVLVLLAVVRSAMRVIGLGIVARKWIFTEEPMTRVGFLVAVLLATGCVPPPCHPTAATRPIQALDTVFTEEMTWMEVRDALAAGKTTVLVATGGVEENGPYLATGKHNVILRATTEAIARKLGNALVAPIVPFVPEGDIDPPTGHMKYPGTISVTEDTFERLLTDICGCFRKHGFRHIVLLGDSGGNQQGMKTVAARLDLKWASGVTRVHYIPEYYDYEAVDKWLERQGIRQIDEGLHDDFAVTAQMMVVDPTAVRMKQRLAVGKFCINGVDLAPAARTIEWGKKIIAFRTEQTTQAIGRAIRRESK